MLAWLVRVPACVMDGDASARLMPETSPAQRHLAAEPEVVESVADMRAKIEALRSAHAAALTEIQEKDQTIRELERDLSIVGAKYQNVKTYHTDLLWEELPELVDELDTLPRARNARRPLVHERAPASAGIARTTGPHLLRHPLAQGGPEGGVVLPPAPP